MRRLPAVLWLAIGSLSLAASARAADPPAIRFRPMPATGTTLDPRSALRMQLGAEDLAAMRTAPALRLELPIPGRPGVEVGLERYDVFAEGSSIHATGAGASRALRERPIVFRGGVVGRSGSIAVAVITDR